MQCNCQGKRGKKALDPQRLLTIQDNTFRLWPLESGENAKQAWTTIGEREMKVVDNSITVFGWAWSTNCNAVYLNPLKKLYHISPRLACTVLLISQSWFNRICCNKSSKKVKVTGINWISIKHLYSGSIVQRHTVNCIICTVHLSFSVSQPLCYVSLLFLLLSSCARFKSVFFLNIFFFPYLSSLPQTSVHVPH